MYIGIRPGIVKQAKAGRFLSRPHIRHKDADDCDDNKKFDEGEGRSVAIEEMGSARGPPNSFPLANWRAANLDMRAACGPLAENSQTHCLFHHTSSVRYKKNHSMSIRTV